MDVLGVSIGIPDWPRRLGRAKNRRAVESSGPARRPLVGTPCDRSTWGGQTTGGASRNTASRRISLRLQHAWGSWRHSHAWRSSGPLETCRVAKRSRDRWNDGIVMRAGRASKSGLLLGGLEFWLHFITDPPKTGLTNLGPPCRQSPCVLLKNRGVTAFRTSSGDTSLARDTLQPLNPRPITRASRPRRLQTP